MEGFVSLFFVLSGFVLFRPYAVAAAVGSPWPGVGRYALRRVLRILPAYWLLVVVCFLTVTDEVPDLGTWIRHLTLTQHYTQQPLLPGVGIAWTLVVEAVFYALLPALAVGLFGRAGRRHPAVWRPGRTVAIQLAAGFVISIAWLSQIRPGRLSVFLHANWFPSFAMCFAVGMAMAVASVARHTGTAPRRWAVLDHLGQAPWACASIGVGLFALSTSAAGPLGGLGIPTAGDLVAEQLLYLGASTFILLPVVFGARRTGLHAVLAHPVPHWVGTVSYGLFLWHPTVVHAIAAVQGPPWGTSTVRLFLLTLAGGLLLAAVSWYGVERPALRLGDRLIARARARASRSRALAAAPAVPGNQAEPERRDGEQAGHLRPHIGMGTLGGEPEPAGRQ
jgi:peptidoglycan/LPS O-acetylase OafA/YrhL